MQWKYEDQVLHIIVFFYLQKELGFSKSYLQFFEKSYK